MRRLLQRLLMPIALVAVTQTTIVSAESIRLTGPNGEIQSSPQFSEQITRRTSAANEPSRFYGPTTGQETLWSVASRLRPSNQVSVQQTLLSIYQLNPQAFENQNIHTLIPGSTLRVPSLAQVSSVSNEEAVRIMDLHQARLNSGVAPTEVRPASTKPSAPQANQTPLSTPEKTSVESQAAAKPSLPIAKPSTKPSTTPVVKPAEVTNLEQQLQSSESELTALEEKNHRLRLMLAEVQTEVDGLKQELGDENRIRSEVERLLEAERQRLADEQRNAPSTLDKILSNGWMVAGLAVVPGLLIGLLVMMLLGRNRAESEQASPELSQASNAPTPVAPIMPETLDEEVEDELDLDDDLFGESSDDELLFSDDLEGEKDETPKRMFLQGLMMAI
ncbi:beta-glucosidase [Vibrio ponticus]|nr:beta-glucosidase [Vibrio ponticus]